MAHKFSLSRLSLVWLFVADALFFSKPPYVFPFRVVKQSLLQNLALEVSVFKFLHTIIENNVPQTTEALLAKKIMWAKHSSYFNADF